MPDELIPVKEVADRLQTRKQQVFKLLKRLRIEATKQRSSDHGNQITAFITSGEYDRVAEEHSVGRSAAGQGSSDEVAFTVGPDVGVFYLVQLEPDHDPGRFKVGFASSMPDRLRKLRCSAPFATVMQTWPCKLLWERTAMDCVTVGCDRIHTEVFRTDSLQDVLRRCEAFFALMPDLHEEDGEANNVDATDRENCRRSSRRSGSLPGG